MAITSIGYDGTVDETQFGSLIKYSASSEFGVSSQNAFYASVVAGQHLQVKIKGGTLDDPAAAWTSGLVDVMDADETLQLENITSGSRWDLIAMRRNYQPPGGESKLVVIKGGSSKSIPARNTNSGVLEDQPLWLVKVQAGSSIVTEFVDLRIWARNGGVVANDDMVRGLLYKLGTEININGKVWQLVPGPNQTASWELIRGAVSPWINVAPSSNYNAIQGIQVRTNGDRTEMRATLQRKTGKIPKDRFERLCKLPATQGGYAYTRQPLAGYANEAGVSLTLVINRDGAIDIGAAGGDATDVYIDTSWFNE